MKKFIPIAIILILMLLYYLLDLQQYLSLIQNSPLLFTLIYALVVALSIPIATALTLFAGFLFPFPYSMFYVIIGATLGASTLFLAARTALSEILHKKASPFLKKMEAGFNKNPASYLLFLRFIPLFPFWLVNLAPAFFNVRFRTYLWTTVLGILPGSYIYTQAGMGLSNALNPDTQFTFTPQMIIALILLAIISLLPILYKKYASKR